jgi:pimeloyl-ACP methyl ester carboxylesterase
MGPDRSGVSLPQDGVGPARRARGGVNLALRPGVHELRVAVSDRLQPAGPIEIAATLFLPEPEALLSPPVVIFGVPGGGYSRGYFDMHFPGHESYSEAEYHTARGFIFVACDPVGVGDSTLLEPAQITFELLAACHDAAVREICARLAAGTLAAGFPALSHFLRIGIGQSMGGKITVLAQGLHRTFDGIGVLGASAIHTVLPQPTEAGYEAARSGHTLSRGAAVDGQSVAQSSRSIGDFVYPFHWEDVPGDIIQADMGGGYPLRRPPPPPFGSLTIPPCAVTMMSPGAIAREAAAITVPVLVGVGERDTCPNPLAEPAAYPKSDDVAVYIVPRMAHMHNFASTRAQLWQLIEAWARRLSQMQPR